MPSPRAKASEHSSRLEAGLEAIPLRLPTTEVEHLVAVRIPAEEPLPLAVVLVGGRLLRPLLCATTETDRDPARTETDKDPVNVVNHD